MRFFQVKDGQYFWYNGFLLQKIVQHKFCVFKLENGEGESLLSTIKIYSYPFYYFNFNNEEEAYYHFDGCIVEELTLKEVNQLKVELL